MLAKIFAYLSHKRDLILAHRKNATNQELTLLEIKLADLASEWRGAKEDDIIRQDELVKEYHKTMNRLYELGWDENLGNLSLADLLPDELLPAEFLRRNPPLPSDKEWKSGLSVSYTGPKVGTSKEAAIAALSDKSEQIVQSALLIIRVLKITEAIPTLEKMLQDNTLSEDILKGAKVTLERLKRWDQE